MDKHDPISERQVSPKPIQKVESHLDKVEALRGKIRAHPQASADEIIAMLAAENIEVSATLVFQEMARERG